MPKLQECCSDKGCREGIMTDFENEFHTLKAAFQAQLKENGDDAEKVDSMSNTEFLDIVFSFWEKSDLLVLLTAVAPHSAPFCYYRKGEP